MATQKNTTKTVTKAGPNDNVKKTPGTTYKKTGTIGESTSTSFGGGGGSSGSSLPADGSFDLDKLDLYGPSPVTIPAGVQTTAGVTPPTVLPTIPIPSPDVGGGGDGGGSGTVAPDVLPTTPTPVAPTGPTPEELAAQAAAARKKLEDDAYAKALGYGNEQVKARGLNQGLVDQYGVLDAYKAMIDEQRGKIGGDVADPFSQYNTDSSFNNVLDSGQGRYRTDLRNTITDQFGDNFEYNAFADTSDDPLLQSILDAQGGDAKLVLDRAKARGQLNGVGYGRANNELNTQRTAGMSALQSAGGGVLADYRKQLLDTKNQGLNAAGTANFNTPYNANSIVDRLNALKGDLTGRLQGDITRAVGGTSFFTPTNAIGKGGTVQGTINPSKINFADNPLLTAFQTASGRKAYGNNNGSLASTGSF